MNNLSYFSSARQSVLRLVDCKHKIIRSLDVGCGTGAFSELLKHEHKCETWGIEPDLRGHKESALSLDKALLGTWDSQLINLPHAYFSAVFFNDVLEHMADPAKCLVQARALLDKQGRVYASIPNFIFADNIATLLWSRDWKYQDSGILDKTHLRFFTRLSIERLFREAGFRVNALIPLSQPESWKWRLLSRLTFKCLDDFRVYQYGVAASPA